MARWESDLPAGFCFVPHDPVIFWRYNGLPFGQLGPHFRYAEVWGTRSVWVSHIS